MEQGSERYLWGLLSKMKIFNSTLKPRYTGYKKNVEEVYPNKRSGNATDFEDLQKTDVTKYPLYNMTKRNGVYPTTTDYNLNDVISTNTPAGSRYPARLQVIFDKLRWKCLEEQNNETPLETDGPYCYRMVDAYGGCWPDTMPGKYAKISCPDIPMLFNHKGHAYRECTLNGTWFVNATSNNTWANYSECRQTEEISDDNKYIYIFIGGFSLSLVMLIISLCIFFRFRQLRCDRITIHKNLFMSYVLTGISWILYYVLAALNGDVIVSNPIWCQALHILCQYFMVCNFLWMFCEGLYLNTIMVCAFNSGKILIISCYAVGWGLPIIFTTTYAVIRSSNADYSVDCWIQESSLLWIVYGPVVVSIGVNVLFLINIVRLLITKLRQMPEADQTRKATRATLILVPLLGLQYLLFPVRPEAGSDLEDVYHVAVALLVSLQGAFVSLMYCFCNSEVIQVLRRKWNQHRLMHRSSMRASTNHGTTYTTMDPVTQANTTYCSTADHKGPSLEMTNMEDKANN